MAKTPKEGQAEPDARIAITDECNRALKKLSAKPELLLTATGPDELYEALRKHGAKSDLLKIVECWREKSDHQWVLNELRRWNTGAH